MSKIIVQIPQKRHRKTIGKLLRLCFRLIFQSGLDIQIVNISLIY